MTDEALPFWLMVTNPYVVAAVIGANSLAIALSVLFSAASYPAAIARSLKLFGAGKLASAVGFALVALRGELSPLWSVAMGNTLAIGGFSANLLALWTLQGRPWRLAPPCGAVVATLIVSVWFSMVEYDLRALRLTTSAIMFAICLYLGTELLRHRSDGRAHILGGWLSLIMAVATAMRFVGALSADHAPGHLLALDWAERAFLVLVYVAATMSALNFCLISNDAFNGELRRLASSDPLTGLPNRRRLVERGEEEIRRARRYRRPLAALVMDLDHFKSINDLYGHVGGDAALKATAAACRKTLRDVDMFGRLGGEEFVAVLPETSLDEAAAAGERLRSALACLIVDETNDLRLTASFGAAVLRNGENFTDLLARADAAMYCAKRAGRDRVEIAED